MSLLTLYHLYIANTALILVKLSNSTYHPLHHVIGVPSLNPLNAQMRARHLITMSVSKSTITINC